MNRSNALFVGIMFLLFTLVSSSLLWRFDTEITQYSEFQESLMQKQARISAIKIHNIITSIRNRMIAITRDHLLSDDLSLFQTNDDVQEKLFSRLKLYFPEMYAFTLSDKFGEQIGGDIDMFIGDACLADLDQMSEALQKSSDYFNYEPRVHAKAGAYHFDMMLPALILNEPVIFFMSFKTDLLSEALNENRISEHFSYLLRVDKPELIEVSTEGNREQLKRAFYLAPAEVDNIVSRELVPHTKWEVVLVRNPAVLEAYRIQRLNDALILFSVFFLLWLALFWYGIGQERKRVSRFDALSHLSMHDSLTGIGNRRKLALSLQQALNDFVGLKQISGLLYMDLNGFKKINDLYGHAVGDEVLKQFSVSIKDIIRQQDIVARLGGDEFVVLLPNIAIEHAAAQSILNDTCARFKKALSQKYTINEHEFFCSPSVGQVLLAESNLTVDSILKQADYAMYEHKLETRRIQSRSNLIQGRFKRRT